MTDSGQKILFANSTFEFSSYACDCEVDITHPSKGVTRHTYRLYPKEESIYYAYIPKEGLVSKKRKGANNGIAVLQDLLAIKDDDSKAVKTFIEKHGFFMALDVNENNSIDSDILFGLINRLKATISLMSAIGENKTSYEKIIALSLYLLLTPQLSIKLSDGNKKTTTCPHKIGQIWNNTAGSDEFFQLKNFDEMYNNMGGYIKDSIRPPNTWIDMSEYQYAVDYCQQYPSSTIAKATCLFVEANKVDFECRLAIDFLYHFCKEIGEIKAWDYKGKLTLIENNSTANILSNKRFDESLQKALLKLAKNTIKVEIEHNITGVVPSYDIESMAPSWRVNSLLTGMYFSLFYMRPEIEIYRTCANERCGKTFLVKSTSHNKKYCSDLCGNAMAQHNFRLRKNNRQITNIQ